MFINLEIAQDPFGKLERYHPIREINRFPCGLDLPHILLYSLGFAGPCGSAMKAVG